MILVGRLTRDPEVKDVKGVAICNFSIATSREWKDDGGEKHEKTEFHNLVAFRKTADLCGKYLTKGRQAYVEGELQTRNWEKDGVKHYRTEIVVNSVQFLGDSKNQKPQTVEHETTTEPSFDQQPNDDIPF